MEIYQGYSHMIHTFKNLSNGQIQNYGKLIRIQNYNKIIVLKTKNNQLLTASGVDSAERLASFKEPLFRNLISKNISLFTHFIFN